MATLRHSQPATSRTPVVVAVSEDAVMIDKINHDLSHAHLTIEQPSEQQLKRAICYADALLVDIDTDDAQGRIDLIRRARVQEPDLPVVAVTHLTPVAARLLLLCGRIGVNGVALVGSDHLGEVVQQMLTTDGRSSPFRRVARAVEKARTPTATAALLEAALAVVSRGGHVKRLCGRLGMSRRTLERRFASAGLATPGVTLDWLRVALAAELLLQMRSTKEVAMVLGFGRERTLNAVVRRCIQGGIHELRRQSGALIMRRYRLAFLENASERKTQAQSSLRVGRCPGDQGVARGSVTH